MKHAILLSIAMLFLCNCQTHLPDKKSPKSAFARLSKCVDNASTKCLLWELDTETRWSVSTVYKLLKEIRKTVETSYPQDPALRASVYGKWKEEVLATNVEQMFEILCKKRNCLTTIAQGYGAATSLEQSGETASIMTVRNKRFKMRKTKDTWGIVLFDGELSREKIRLADSLKQVKRNAAEYEQQRLATGQK